MKTWIVGYVAWLLGMVCGFALAKDKTIIVWVLIGIVSVGLVWAKKWAAR